MNVVVTIYTPNQDVGSSITIEQVEGTDNYEYRVTIDHDNWSESWSGTVYNFTGHYYELVKQVMNGRTVHRED